MSTKGRLELIKDEIKELKEKARRAAIKTFEDEAASIFEKFPTLTAFGWTQYTPYYNDGDTCVFSGPYDVDYLFDGEEPTEDNCYIDWTHEAIGFSDYYTERMKADTDNEVLGNQNLAMLAVSELVAIFDDDDWEQMFGDHARVFVTKSGSFTVEYDHD